MRFDAFLVVVTAQWPLMATLSPQCGSRIRSPAVCAVPRHERVLTLQDWSLLRRQHVSSIHSRAALQQVKGLQAMCEPGKIRMALCRVQKTLYVLIYLLSPAVVQLRLRSSGNKAPGEPSKLPPASTILAPSEWTTRGPESPGGLQALSGPRSGSLCTIQIRTVAHSEPPAG